MTTKCPCCWTPLTNPAGHENSGLCATCLLHHTSAADTRITHTQALTSNA